jgi:hypothetical protein
MTRGEGGATQVGRHPTAQEHHEALHDVALLQENRTLLVQRLERVVVALALTLDGEAAAEERLTRIEELAGVRRISNLPAAKWAMLAQRYRDLLHAIDSINGELHPDSRRRCL